MKFKLLAVIAVAALAPLHASAACTGTGSSAYCWDDSGNTYNVQRYGSTTYLQGSNPNTGSTWNQTSQTYGNTTYHSGQAADGNSWSGTTQRYGNTTIHQGTDSNGNTYSKTCNQFGCF